MKVKLIGNPAVETPMSLRSHKQEAVYQLAKLSGGLVPLGDEQAVCDFTYWKMIRNRFPYDVCMAEHDLLIPRRNFGKRSDMSIGEEQELKQIINGYGEKHYDAIIDNMVSKRSITSLYHIHFVKYIEDREDMKL